MRYNVIKFEKYGTFIGILKGKKPIITDEQTFIDILVQTKHDADTELIVVEKALFPDEFFKIDSGFAAMVYQKVINSRVRMAVIGDFKEYDDEFHEFIESNNKEGDLVFMRSVNEAITYFTE